jgi:diguanylate cyclase (GGDEF)-like protein/PAS domain S-box-containing protein
VTERVKARILAIDDVPANLMTLGAALSKEFTLQIASSGAMGLIRALETPPDLILLDVMMPEMDGYETFRRLRTHPTLQDVPIIFVTAMHEMDAEMEGLALGAADYITKPIQVEIARQRIRNLIERESLRTELRHQRDLLQAEATERQLVVEALHASEENYRLLVDDSHDIIYTLTSEGVFTFVSPAWTALLGHPVSDVVGQHFSVFVHPDDIPVCARVMNDVVNAGIRQASAEYRVRDSGDGWRWHRSNVASWKDAHGKIVGIEGVATDITERHNMEEAIRQMAFHDTLTKLPNRRMLTDRLQMAIASCARHGTFGALMFLDLDNFKPLNDQHGHEAGDQLLLQVAERIRKCVREMDTVARFGGDEFVVLLSKLSNDLAESESHAAIVAEKIRSVLAEPYKLSAQAQSESEKTIYHSCSASMGVAMFNGASYDLDEIIKLADVAMYRAKDHGKNTVAFGK